ncbi:type I-F CRISPR-associated endoribonuclease Cas6/Csy4 [Ideonella sp.]|jgi:CRISPR-associated endonuclease Csy4|uniref:type I-F CRISPR-associated endoribonuclease Cas6/Csy4 n=1 Tax=Ideonella sp. TaxID=1929293 RepID=UPI0037BF978E
MLTHYLDIHLRPDPEFPASQLLAALYAKLHRALVQLHSEDLAVSFPGYSDKPLGLGQTLRVLGTAERLRQLMALPWLSGMTDHVQVSATATVPADVVHRQLSRVQAKSSPERLRRRQMKRHGLTAEQARERIPDSAAESLKLPFLPVRSASTGQSFMLFLRLGPPCSAAAAGGFNAYGLSTTATTPWF